MGISKCGQSDKKKDSYLKVLNSFQAISNNLHTHVYSSTVKMSQTIMY